MAEIVEDLYGCYLLYCLNKKYKGQTYIGFTVNPQRRIKQHNAGVKAGGARRTHARGPWEMVLMVYGFPNDVSALRFEWAWQNPNKSRRLKHINSKTSRENAFKYRVRIMCEMLRVGPWNRLPLTIQWLKQDYIIEFPPHLLPPVHMPINFGPIISKKIEMEKKKGNELDFKEKDKQISTDICDLCSKRIEFLGKQFACPNQRCTMKCHIICCARHFLKHNPEQIIPIEGECPICQQCILWGDFVRYKRGCYKNINKDKASESEHWTSQLTAS